MELRFVKIDRRDGEVLVLGVTEQCNLSSFLVMATYEDNCCHSDSYVYSFPSIVVNAGDYILLYTNAGRTDNYINKGRTTSYAFHWGKDADIWQENVTKLSIIKAQDIVSQSI